MDPLESPRGVGRIAFLLERSRAPTYRVGPFRTAARTPAAVPAREVAERAAAGSPEALRGVGPTTARVVAGAPAGQVPGCLRGLEAEAAAAGRRGGRLTWYLAVPDRTWRTRPYPARAAPDERTPDGSCRRLRRGRNPR
jgi:putative hydrolase